MKKAFPILGILTAIFLSYALYLALVVAPREQTMGDVQRIFYYHVPSAWTAFLLFFINFRRLGAVSGAPESFDRQGGELDSDYRRGGHLHCKRGDRGCAVS